MNIPKKIHYFWVGNNIPEKFMENIIKMKLANPGFEVHLWTNNNSLFLNTFRSMTKSFGEIFGCEFDKIRYGSNEVLIRNIKDAFELLNKDPLILIGAALTSEPQEINFLILESLFYRNIHGYYKNYALASDIARLVILYVEGGIYLDVDVELKLNSKDPISDLLKTTKAKFKDNCAPLDIAFGDITAGKEPTGALENKAWVYNSFGGNAIIAAPPKSKKILALLRLSQKKFNINKNYYDLNKTLRPSNKPRNINSHYPSNPINPGKQIQLINLADPSKPIQNKSNNQNGFPNNPYDKYPHGNKDTWSASRVIPDFRSDITIENTGPKLYEKYLRDIDKDRLPNEKRPSAKFRIEENDNRLFRKVNADKSNWGTVEKKDIGHTDDAEFPSRSGFTSMYDQKIKQFMKKW
ncbi:hypothetical protein FE392_08175 [Xenorhabdus sp. 12]|uniref:Uncharacterized protein n=1 Tax=Xenorhabdus santafensis TaxID=2582833 RepID=A0ABU4S923_9GAMM|nr:glycosyltransferase [Xenorhabdus sp. 12]MDX7987307.1 hypothetical protein [Xenorhabdus sp. 12]